MNILYFVFVVIMTFLGALAALCLKRASECADVFLLVKNQYFYIGGVLYVLAALINIYVLRFLDYSIVLPLTSLTYVWTMILSRFVLHENITEKKILGVCLIMAGAVLLVLKN